MKFLRQSDEVYYAEGDLLTLSRADFDFFKQQARQSPRKIARLCTHRHMGDRLHEMTIVNLHETYIRPHKNTAKPKSFLVLEGAMDVVMFDDIGNIIGVIPLGAPGSGLPHYFRLHETRFHTLRTRSEAVVFQETTIGPFEPGDTVFARWAPDGTAPGFAAPGALERLDSAVKRYLTARAA